METKRAIDTSLPVSKEQNTERQGLKMHENVSNAQSNENVVGPQPGIDQKKDRRPAVCVGARDGLEPSADELNHVPPT